jgi:hypothetical protein
VPDPHARCARPAHQLPTGAEADEEVARPEAEASAPRANSHLAVKPRRPWSPLVPGPPCVPPGTQTQNLRIKRPLPVVSASVGTYADLRSCPGASPTIAAGSAQCRCVCRLDEHLMSAGPAILVGRRFGSAVWWSWLAGDHKVVGIPCERGEAQAARASVVVADRAGRPRVVSEPMFADRARNHRGAAGAGLVSCACEDWPLGGPLLARAERCVTDRIAGRVRPWDRQRRDRRRASGVRAGRPASCARLSQRVQAPPSLPTRLANQRQCEPGSPEVSSTTASASPAPSGGGRQGS